MPISNLPVEILSSIPDYLDSVDDLYSLLSTSRLFYRCCAGTTAKLAPPFSTEFGQHLLPPHPHLLLAGTARQIGDWAIQSQDNQDRLWKGIKDGNNGLASLSKDVARLSLQDVRALHRLRADLVIPLAARLDLEEDPTRTRWSELTVCQNAEVALLNYLIYCELFHLDVQASFDDAAHEPFNSAMRNHWMSYCMPDGCYLGHRKPTAGECELLDLKCLLRGECFIKALPDIVPDQPFSMSRPQEHRQEFLLRILGHQGTTTLRIILVESVKPAADLIDYIRQKIDMLPQSRIVTEPEYDDLNEHIGWFSMGYDSLCVCGNS